MSSPRLRQRLYFVQLLSALLGLTLSLYLLVQHTRLKSGIQGEASFCSLGKYADCDVVNASSFSEVFGVPIATVGAFFYFLALLLSLLAPPNDRKFPKYQSLLAWLSSVALLIDVALFFVQLFVLKTACLMCFGTYVATAGILFAALKIARQSSSEPWHQVFHQWKGTGTWMPPVPLLSLGSLGTLAFAGLLAFLPSFVRSRSHNYKLVETAVQKFLHEWKDKPVREIPYDKADGIFGNPNATVKIFEFSDFQCPHCRKAAFTLHTFLKPLEQKVFFVFKHFPLDSSCNPSLDYQLHPQACKLARLAYCAGKEKKFWEFHDHVFFDLTEEQIKEGSQLDNRLSKFFTKSEINACMKDPKSLAQVKENIAQANRLGIQGTPTLFINGKQVSIPLSLETLKQLIELENRTVRSGE